HLLTDAGVSATGSATACAARGDVVAEADLAAGTHYVVVDTYQGDAHAGPFELHLEAIGDAWNERLLADGVIWRARRFSVTGGGPQVAHELIVDTTAPSVKVRALAASGCQTVGALGAQAGALAGTNGGYFDTASACAPVSLIKSDGVLVAPSMWSGP